MGRKLYPVQIPKKFQRRLRLTVKTAYKGATRMANDKIILKGMRFFGCHGCLPAELELGQWFEVDLEIALDLSFAEKSDSLDDTLNYAEVYERVKAVVEGPACALIEALAGRLLGLCFDWPQVESVKVLLKKPQAPLGGPLDYAAVEMERRREDVV
jgi:dihydroneopterin aldolase